MNELLGKLLGLVSTIAASFDRRGEYWEIGESFTGSDGNGVDSGDSQTKRITLPTEHGFLMKGFGFSPGAGDFTYLIKSGYADHNIQRGDVAVSWNARSGRGAYNAGGGSKADAVYWFGAGDEITIKVSSLADNNKIYAVLWGEKIDRSNPRYKSLDRRHTAKGS